MTKETGRQSDIPNKEKLSNGSAGDTAADATVDSDVEKAADCYRKRRLAKKDKQGTRRLIKTELRKVGKKRQDPPSVSLSLRHVFGYRGYDCQGNIHFTRKGELAYHIAAIGVILDPTSGKQRFYIGHTDDILCIAIHPVKDFLATGQVGKHPTVHVWDPESLKLISLLKGDHTGGISAVDFSDGDGKFLVSVGMDDTHLIVVWDWQKGTKLATARGHNDAIFAVRFNARFTEKFATAGVRHIKFWTLSEGKSLSSQRGIFGNVSKIETMLCICYGSEENVCYSGSASGLVYVWKENKLLKTIQVNESTNSPQQGLPCFAIEMLEKGFVTGGKDGVVSLWDSSFQKCLKKFPIESATLSKDSPPLLVDRPVIRAATLGHGKIVAGTKNGEAVLIDQNGVVTVLTQGHAEGEVWGLDCHPSERQCVTVSDDRFLRIWSTSPPLRLLAFKNVAKSARAVAYSPDGSMIAIGFKDGGISVIKASQDFKEIFKHHHRAEEISVVKFSPGSGEYLAVGSHDNFVDIYNIASRKRVGVCKGSSSYITHIDWTHDGSLLQTNSGAGERLFFKMPTGTRKLIDADKADNLQWATWTCVLGDTCEGIWPPESNITDVNAVALNPAQKIIASGDDFGYVKLFAYPAKGKFARAKEFLGHSAHVTNLCWTKDNELLTTGGADTSLCVWSLTENDPGQDSDTSNEFADKDSPHK